MMKLLHAMMLLVCTVLAGCATTERPQTFIEQVAYAEAGAQAALKTIGDLTCLKYTQAGACVEPGKPIHPARAKGYVDQIGQARAAARAAAAMPASGGTCLGQPSTPTACLQLASAVLGEVQKILLTLQKGG